MSGLEGEETQKPWIVLNFGGTSVARAERWDHIAARARELSAYGAVMSSRYNLREPAAEIVLDR